MHISNHMKGFLAVTLAPVLIWGGLYYGTIIGDNLMDTTDNIPSYFAFEYFLIASLFLSCVSALLYMVDHTIQRLFNTKKIG